MKDRVATGFSAVVLFAGIVGVCFLGVDARKYLNAFETQETECTVLISELSYDELECLREYAENFRDINTIDEELARRVREAPEFTFEELLYAIEYYESKGVATARGADGELGAYQIKGIYLDDFDRITGKTHSRIYLGADVRYSIPRSRYITGVATQHYAHLDCPDADINDIKFLEQAARSHKGAGIRNTSETDEYWQAILAVMKN